ncbi:ABC transporter permease subunit [Rossellomorea sp. AcN35-11]|nr:ABC transporter permease subunit [Rossellomorea sp. AcN35-11]
MNIYWREMKAHRKSFIIWCIGMIALIGSGMGKFAGFNSSGQTMNELMEQMPKSLQAFLGVGSLDLSTATGFYGVLYIYILLLATIHAVILGATIISKEERDKTVEFLFVKPVNRNHIIGVKLMAAFTQIVILTGITWISTLLMVGHYSEDPSIGGGYRVHHVSHVYLANPLCTDWYIDCSIDKKTRGKHHPQQQASYW